MGVASGTAACSTTAIRVGVVPGDGLVCRLRRGVRGRTQRPDEIGTFVGSAGGVMASTLLVVITFDRATKRYGDKVALDDLSLEIAPGRVTALLGPNGAGKSTAIRMLLGLARATAGRALVAGRPYAEHRDPLRVVGAHLDGRAVHPGRSARQHLVALARASGLEERRVDVCLEVVGLVDVGRQSAGGFSLGMAQRLGIAAALLGDPQVLVLDEPVNGLDTDGVRWVRELLRGLADDGRTVLISSHLLAEVERTADHVVVLGRGRLLADCDVGALVEGAADEVLAVMPDAEARRGVAGALPAAVVTTDPQDPTLVIVRGSSAEEVGDVAHRLGLRLHGLVRRSVTLEDAYRRLVEGQVDHVAGAAVDSAVA